MKYPAVSRISYLILASLLLLASCDGGSPPTQSQTAAEPAVSDSSAVSNNDAQIRVQVESALADAGDLPPGFSVAVNSGVVSISGSLQCEDCGGMRTPGNTGTIQQSLGSVVRAVPGVERVEFDLDYRN